MLKTLLTIILLLNLSVYPQQERCKCKLPKVTSNAEEDDPEREYIYKKMYGQVNTLGGEPIEDMTIEVYNHPELRADSSENSKVKQKLVAHCKTDKNGMFCFEGIKSGKYEIRVSDHETNRKWGPWEDVTLLVTINPKHPQSTDKLIKTYLQFRI
jgi:protocatechuate 3,4-dioxygenase beta subunit